MRMPAAAWATWMAGAVGALAGCGAAPTAFQERDGLVVMQVESVPPAGGWALQSEFPGHSGRGYYTWCGKDLFQRPGEGVLAYRFHVSNPGTYRMHIRSLHVCEDRSRENDVWARMDGGLWMKTFATPNKQWTWATRHDFGGYKPQAAYELGRGDHLLELSGRSRNFRIDVIHLFGDGAPAARDPAAAESALVPAGDLAPRAHAGPDRYVNLPCEPVVLTGAGSDEDGRVVGYEWKQLSGPAASMAWQGSRLAVRPAAAGEHWFGLTVTDEAGGTGIDRVKLTVYDASAASTAGAVFAVGEGETVLEAESASCRQDWKLEAEDEGFSGTGYLVWRGRDLFDEPGQGQLAYRLRVEGAGRYRLAVHNRHDGRLRDQQNDTWVRFDDGPWFKLFAMELGRWTWESSVTDRGGVWDLPAGEHTLYLSARSAGHKLDRIRLTRQDAPAPEGAQPAGPAD
ncbi:MAG TPA: hypothetical protein VM389_02415 [Phycisphaerae bacterium]|nr:hypothetical protein [Phycisphaerae bacterium]